MGVTFIEFFIVFLFLVIICAMVIGIMVLGTREKAGLGFDKDYLWQDFIKKDKDLLNKVNLRE